MSESEPKRIAVVGFGYIGCVIGAVLADRGHDVVGLELDRRIVDAVNDGMTPFNEPYLDDYVRRAVAAGSLRAHLGMTDVSDRDAVLITVGTPLGDDFAADLGQLEEACRMLAGSLRDGQLVMIKSTVPPGTTSRVAAPILRRSARVLLAFCPERLAEGKAIEELEAFPVVVGGVDVASSQAAAAFWRDALGLEAIVVGNAEEAEMVKLADNLWIDLNIALAGELAKLCDRFGGMDVLQVIAAANSLPKGAHHVNILTPSVGVGGYCLTKDPWFVHALGRELGLELQTPRVSRQVNDSMPAYSAALIDEALTGTGTAAEELTVAILGLAFKNNTGDCRFTPTKGTIDALRQRGFKLKLFDPWVSVEDARTVTDLELEPSLEETIAGADCVAFLAGHDDFRALPLPRVAELANDSALVFDGRMFFSGEEIARMRSLGLRYKGVGR